LNNRQTWDNLLLRLRSAVKDQKCSVITLRIVTDEQGQPLLWTEPEITCIEPVANVRKLFAELMMGLTK